MKEQKPLIFFQREEVFITGLPEVIGIDSATQAFDRVRAARRSCYEDYERLLNLDPALRTGEDKAKMPSYEARVKKLDDLSFNLGLLTDDLFEFKEG